MDQSKLHYSLIAVALFLCVFMYVDAYLLPVDSRTEKVLSVKDNIKRSRAGTSHGYLLVSTQRQYDVTATVYNYFGDADTVQIERSAFSGAVQKMVFTKEGNQYTVEVGFIRARDGMLYVPFIFISAVILLVTYRKISNPSGRRNLTFFVFVASLILTLFYLDLNIF